MILDKGLLLQIVVYVATMGAAVGTILYRIKALEKKVEAHNDLVVRMAKAERELERNIGLAERMAKTEQQAKAAHQRLDRLEGQK